MQREILYYRILLSKALQRPVLQAVLLTREMKLSDFPKVIEHLDGITETRFLGFRFSGHYSFCNKIVMLKYLTCLS